MRHGRSHGPRVLRRLAIVLAGAFATTLALGAAHAQTQAVPSNTSLPTISGNATAGQTLTASPGTWSGTTPMTFAYQWLRCDSAGNNCANITGETTVHRVVDSGDVGHRLRVKVTATNSDGATSATSAATAVIASSGSGAPVNTTEPVVSGTTVQGQTLSATTGTWSGATPITYKYQWLRCDTNAANCSAIAGEMSPSRILSADDVGHRLRVRVTATNSSGSASADSNGTNTITGTGGSSGAPKNTVLPAISGSAVQGQSLVSTDGTWTGTSPITFTYQWQRCDANGNSCASITGETKHNRTLSADDVGHRLRITVTAKNSAGSATAQSGASDVVTSSGTGGPLPDGAVKLPSGKYSIPVTSVSLPTQLVIDKVKFSPNPVTSRTTPIVVKVHVSDTRGYVVRDALVFVRSVPLLTTTPPETPTGQDGWVTFQIFPTPDFPLKNRSFVQFFVRVRKAGDNVLVGVGSRRLVQVRTARPS